MRTKRGNFKTPYTKKLIIRYLKAVYDHLGKSPTFRDLNIIPGPSPRTIVRHFGTWAKALKASGIRPQTNQLMKGERSFIRNNWRKLNDKEIAQTLGLTPDIIKYYRMQYNLWKNRKGTSKQKHKSDGMRLYGKNCEVCNIPVTELHHIIPKSKKIDDWSILCPTCHAAITRKLVVVNTREELQTKLAPYMKELYKNLRFRQTEVVGNDISST